MKNCEHTGKQPDYAWLIPHWPPLHRFYHFSERHPVVYVATWPLWFGRYHWLLRAPAWRVALIYRITPQQGQRLLDAIREARSTCGEQ